MVATDNKPDLAERRPHEGARLLADLVDKFPYQDLCRDGFNEACGPADPLYHLQINEIRTGLSAAVDHIHQQARKTEDFRDRDAGLVRGGEKANAGLIHGASTLAASIVQTSAEEQKRRDKAMTEAHIFAAQLASLKEAENYYRGKEEEHWKNAEEYQGISDQAFAEVEVDLLQKSGEHFMVIFIIQEVPDDRTTQGVYRGFQARGGAAKPDEWPHDC